MAKTEFTVTMNVLNFPEALAMIRKRLADLLREDAESEADPRIARRLREIAADFEVGL